jgi:hypothetical protein
MKLIMESWRKFLKEDEVGKRLTVYRIGSSVGELSNRNAANLKGIIAFMDTECEDLKPAYCFPKGITITEYEIELTAPTVDYKCLRGGTSRNPFSMDGDKTPQCPAEAGVGVREGSGWGDLSYSFLEEGQGWKLVSVGKSIPIVDVPDNIGYIGWVEALEILEGLFSGGELNEGKYGKKQSVLNRESYSDMIKFSGASELFVPLGAGLMKRVFGDLPEDQTGYHITDLHGAYGLVDLQGSTKQVSVMTRGIRKEFIKDGITNKGGVVVELEGRVIASGAKDLFSIPEKGGRRNIMLKMLKSMLPPDAYRSLRDEILKVIEGAQDAIQLSFDQEKVGPDMYDDGEFEADQESWRQEGPLVWWYNILWKVDGKTKHQMIKYYLDSVEKIMVKYVEELREAILDEFKGSDKNYQAMGIYDENIMDKIRIKNVYLLDTYYRKRGMPGYPTDMELKQFISDMESEGVDLYKAKVQEIIDTVSGKLVAK